MEFDPDSPRNIAAAHTAQAIAGAQAHAIEGDTLVVVAPRVSGRRGPR